MSDKFNPSRSPYPKSNAVIQRVMPHFSAFIKAWLPTAKEKKVGGAIVYVFNTPNLYKRSVEITSNCQWEGTNTQAKGSGLVSLYAHLNEIDDMEIAEAFLIHATWQNFYPYVSSEPVLFNYKDAEGKSIFTKTVILDGNRPKVKIEKSEFNKVPAFGIPLFGRADLMQEENIAHQPKLFILPTEMEVRLARALFDGSGAKFTTPISMAGKFKDWDVDFTEVGSYHTIIFINTARMEMGKAVRQVDKLCNIIQAGWGPYSLTVAKPDPYTYHRALWGTFEDYYRLWDKTEYVDYRDFGEVVKRAPSPYKKPTHPPPLTQEQKKNNGGTQESPPANAEGEGSGEETGADTQRGDVAKKSRTGQPLRNGKMEVESKAAASKTPPINFLDPESPVRVLGLEEDKERTGVKYVFQSRRTGVIHSFRPGDFTQNQLKSLAPASFWLSAFGPKGMDENPKNNWVPQATSLLMETAQRIHSVNGFVDVSEKRIGRGVFYLTGNRFAAHLGNKVIEEEKPKDPFNVSDPEFIFQNQQPIRIKLTAPADMKERQQFLQLCSKPSWSGHAKTATRLLAGWCALAPFCGALKWKPHIFIHGPSFSGKSKVREMIVEKAVGAWARNAQGVSTEAGIRRMLEFDALPVIHDEADVVEVEKKRGGETVLAKLLKLARTASSEGKGRIIHGDGKTYRIRSMFLFIDISPNISEAADVSRFTKLGLKSRPITKKDQVDDNWVEYMGLSSGLHADFSSRLFSFMWSVRHNIYPTIAIFREELLVGYFGNNGRLADQISPMLAAAYLLDVGECPTKEQVRFNLLNYNFDEVIDISKQTDELILLNTILSLSSNLRDSPGMSLTVGEMIMRQWRGEGGLDSDGYGEYLKERKVLRRLGFYVSKDREFLGIANRTAFLKQALSEERFGSNVREMLLNIAGARQGNTTSFGGDSHRHVRIPMDLILEILGDEEA